MLIERKLHNVDFSKLTLSNRAYSFKTKIDKVDCIMFSRYYRTEIWDFESVFSRKHSENFEQDFHITVFKRRPSDNEIVLFLDWIKPLVSDYWFWELVGWAEDLFPKINFKEIYNDDND